MLTNTFRKIINNQEFIFKLKAAKASLLDCNIESFTQLYESCQKNGIFWDVGFTKQNATFGDGKKISIYYLNNIDPTKRRAAALVVIDASISALEELEQK